MECGPMIRSRERFRCKRSNSESNLIYDKIYKTLIDPCNRPCKWESTSLLL